MGSPDDILARLDAAARRDLRDFMVFTIQPHARHPEIQNDVKLIAVHSEKESFKQRLLDGERAAPPEDCGGTPGYERMVDFLETGEVTYDDDPEGLKTWLDGWRPDAFELATAKAKFDR